jgi:hypothetical protein
VASFISSAAWCRAFPAVVTSFVGFSSITLVIVIFSVLVTSFVSTTVVSTSGRAATAVVSASVGSSSSAGVIIIFTIFLILLLQCFSRLSATDTGLTVTLFSVFTFTLFSGTSTLFTNTLCILFVSVLQYFTMLELQVSSESVCGGVFWMLVADRKSRIFSGLVLGIC